MDLLVCVTDQDYETWPAVRIAVVPGERCDTVAELRAQDSPENALTAVRRDWRGRGVAAPMLRLNEHLGYVVGKTSITLTRALPL